MKHFVIYLLLLPRAIHNKYALVKLRYQLQKFYKKADKHFKHLQ